MCVHGFDAEDRKVKCVNCLSILHGVQVNQRIGFKTLTTIHKALYTTTAPQYLKDLLVLTIYLPIGEH